MAKTRAELRKTKAQKQRDRIVRLLLDGKTQPEVAKLVKCSQPTVSRAWSKYKRECDEAEVVHGPVGAEPGAPLGPSPIPRELGQDPASLAGVVRRARSDEIATLAAQMPVQAVDRAAGFSDAMRALFELINESDASVVPPKVRLDAVKFYLMNGPERIRWGDQRLFAMAHPIAGMASAAGIEAVTPGGEGDGVVDALLLIGSTSGRKVYDIPAEQDASA